MQLPRMKELLEILLESKKPPNLFIYIYYKKEKNLKLHMHRQLQSQK